MRRPALMTVLVAWAIYLFLIAPSLIVIPMSFNGSTELMFPPRSFSLHMYHEFFHGSDWLQATRESMVVAVGTMLLSVAAGVPAAYALARTEFAGRRLLGVVLLAPMLVPTIVGALGLYLYLVHLGLAGTTAGLILGHTTLTTPFVIVIALPPACGRSIRTWKRQPASWARDRCLCSAASYCRGCIQLPWPQRCSPS